MRAVNLTLEKCVKCVLKCARGFRVLEMKLV